MILGIYSALCIQGSQKAFQQGFAIFQTTCGQTCKHESAGCGFPVEGAGGGAGSQDRDDSHAIYVHIHAHSPQTPAAIYTLRGQNDRKPPGLKPWIAGLPF